MSIVKNPFRWVGLVTAMGLAGVAGGCSYDMSAAPPSEQTAMAPSGPGPCPYGEGAMYCFGNPTQPYFTGPGGDGY